MEAMRILLLNAPGVGLHARSSRWGGRKNRSGQFALPIFLAMAAAVLKRAGFSVNLLDAVALNYSERELDVYLKKYPPQVIVLEVSTTSIDQDSEIAFSLKKKTGAIIVFVGAHVTALPEDTMRYYPADVLCIGEYEYTLVDLVNSLCNHKPLEEVAGIVFKKGKEIIATRRRELLDLDSLLFPLYESLPLERYYDPIVRNKPCIPIRTSRGCPYHCIFCVAPQVLYHHTVRYRNPEKVVDEVEHLIKLGVKEIFIDDATFTLNRKHIFSICEELKRRKINIDWSCFGRCDQVDEKMLVKMREAGCYMIRYGIETYDQRILDEAKKRIKLSDIEKAFFLTKRLGMKIHATVMWGLPGESKESIRKTLNKLKELDPDYAQFTIATPYPGTEFFWMMKAEGRFLSNRWSDYDGSCKCVTRLDDLDPKELELYIDSAYRHFYFRPLYIWKRLSGLRRMDEFYYLMKSSFNLIKKVFL